MRVRGRYRVAEPYRRTFSISISLEICRLFAVQQELFILHYFHFLFRRSLGRVRRALDFLRFQSVLL